MTAIYTIGHSTRTLDEFIELLRTHDIRLVVDVRTIPRSRHNPGYNSDTLAPALQEKGIAYRHIPELGGLRRPAKDPINAGWENASFRGFADYMQTEGFAKGLEQLMDAGRHAPTAIMCAEAVPWRCHRSLIGDALLVRGFTVKDIMGRNSLREHALTSFAEVDGERITYPGPQPAERLQHKRDSSP